MRQASIALVTMPFGSLYRPSLGLSLLKPALQKTGHVVDIFYLNFLLADRIGSPTYMQICNSAQTSLLGEWVFSAALFGPNPAADAEYFSRYLPVTGGEEARTALRQKMLAVRDHVEAFLAECRGAIDWRRYDMIGFTSTFQQNTASFALAKRLKEQYPDKLIALGGANAEGVMGQAILQAFPFIDLVCSGEGDLAFPEFVRRWSQGGPTTGVPGITCARESDFGLVDDTTNWEVHDMDALPFPDYGDYFAQYSSHAWDTGAESPRLPFESARGCWWGAKSHCKFCGLNGKTMAFRSKSPDRALAEVKHLYDTYGAWTHTFSAVDNIIDMTYFRSFLPALAALGLTDLDMFYETKANLTREQVEAFAEAGIYVVQPGIESLSQSILALMNKGVSPLQNIQLLKWCKEYGVKPIWNYLYGFPGEDPEEYRRVLDLLPVLAHLDPPKSTGPLRLDRFSPYFNDASGHGFTNVRPPASYRYVYHALSRAALDQFAYYFEYDYADGRDVASYAEPLKDAVLRWQRTEGSELFSVALGQNLVIFDLRPCARQALHVLTGPQRSLYEYCDAIRSRRAVGIHLGGDGPPLPSSEVSKLLDPLLAHGLMLSEANSLLSLAIPLGRYSPGIAGAERFRGFLASHGRRMESGDGSAPEAGKVAIMLEGR